MKETLEEVAERLIFKTIGGNYGIMSSDENDQVDGYYNTYEEAYLTLKLKWQQERMYSEEDMKQFAWECVANFLSNNVNEVEMPLVEVIIDRNSKQFEQFKKK